MSSFRPFWLTTSLAAPAVALLLLLPVSLVPAEGQDKPAPAQQTVAASHPADQRGVAGKALDKVKEVAKSAGDIFNRVPCLPPKGGSKTMGSLPHVASKLVAGKPVMIVAFG